MKLTRRKFVIGALASGASVLVGAPAVAHHRWGHWSWGNQWEWPEPTPTPEPEPTATPEPEPTPTPEPESGGGTTWHLLWDTTGWQGEQTIVAEALDSNGAVVGSAQRTVMVQ